MAFDKMFGIGIVVSAVDRVTAPLRRIQTSMRTTQSSAQAMGGTMLKVGAGMTVVGGLMAGFAVMTVKSTVESQRALGELASLGIKDLKGIENAAQDFSNQFSGANKAAIITASYDIKSGIESLSDTAVGEFTKIAALTARATKASVGDMTELFKTGYGIYKSYYSQMSDIDFGKMFSGGIAQAVQSFATEGPKMKAFVEKLGATATSAGIPMQEQFAIGGMLQATMSGEEAGTKYSAFLDNIATGAQKLGINVLDSNKRLLATPVILDLLTRKYGTTIDAMERIQLQEAMGRKEGMKFIELLLPLNEVLKQKILQVGDAMSRGTELTLVMAKAMEGNPGAAWALMMQRISNTMEIFGNTAAPMLVPILDSVSRMVLAFQKWAAANPGIVKLGMTIMAIGGIALAVAGVITMLGGAILLLTPAIIAGAGAIGGFIVSTATVVVGIVAFGGAIWTLMRSWGNLVQVFRSGWDAISFGFSSSIDHVVGLFTGLVTILFELPFKALEAGKQFVLYYAQGIASFAMMPVNAVEGMVTNVRSFFHASEPKRGPLRGMEQSGFQFTDMYRKGLISGSGGVTTAIEDAASIWASSAKMVWDVSGWIGQQMVDLPKSWWKNTIWGYVNPLHEQFRQALLSRSSELAPPVLTAAPPGAGLAPLVAGGGVDILDGAGAGGGGADAGYGFGGGGGSMVTNNSYTVHVESGVVILSEDGSSVTDYDFDERVKTLLEKVLRR